MAYSFQSFSVGQVFTAAQASQIEVNIRDHVHGAAAVVAIVANGGRVVRSAGDVTTTSTSLVDLTGATVTLTMLGANPADVSFAAVWEHDTLHDSVWVNVAVDGALELGTAGLRDENQQAGGVAPITVAHKTAALTVAAHTIKIQWKTDGGTAKIHANSSESYTFAVYEVK